MSSRSPGNTLFGRRLRAARLRAGVPQDRLGVMIGLDEGCSSARISRYENGIHEAPFSLVEKIANALALPVPYFYCGDDRLAEIIQTYAILTEEGRIALLEAATELHGESLK